MAEDEGEAELPLTEHDDVTHWIGRLNETVSNPKEHARGKGKSGSDQHVHKRITTGHR